MGKGKLWGTKAFKFTVFNTRKSSKREKSIIGLRLRGWWITDGDVFTKFTHLFIQLLINWIFTEYLRCAKHYTILCYENKADWETRSLCRRGKHSQCSLQCNLLNVKITVSTYYMLDTVPHISNSWNTLKQKALYSFYIRRNRLSEIQITHPKTQLVSGKARIQT